MGLRHRQFAMTWSAAMLSASLLGGCLMLPTRDTTEAPPIAPHLPPALLASSDPVIVIAQQSTTKRGSDSWENLSKNIRTWETSHALDIRIVPARALSELHKGLAQSVTSGVWIGMCGGYKCMTHQDAYRWEYLDKLFIVSVDGTEIALRPFPKSWETLWARAINSARRDAIVSALRDSGESPFDKLDGPCGVSGTVKWDPEVRKRTISLLIAIPDRPADDPGPPSALAALARKADAGGARDNKTLLLAGARWRDRTITAPPRLLDDTDFDAFVEASARVSPADFSLLFPDHLAEYRAGRRALNSLDIESVCAIRSTGEFIYWSTVQADWRRGAALPPYRDWQRETLDLLKGATRSAIAGDACITAPPAGWTDAQRAQAIAFVEALPVQDAPHAAREVLTAHVQSLTTVDPAKIPAIIVVEMFFKTDAGDRVSVAPFAVAPGQDPAETLRVIASISPDEIQRALEIKGTSSTRRICMIDAAGTVNMLARDNASNAWRRSEPSRMNAPRRDAAVLALADQAGAQPPFLTRVPPCSIPHATWPADDLRERVRRFVERTRVPPVDGKFSGSIL